jgi:PAS domain S-box-containing protein
MAECLVVVSPEAIIQTVNQGTCDLLGYKEEELIGKKISFIFAEELRFKDKGLEEIIKKGFVRNEEKICLSKDGRKIPALWSGSVMRHRNGKIQGIVCLVQDITERKQAEEQKRNLEENLQRSQKMESLGILAGGVAHDLNNVLTGIVSFPELILLDMPKDHKQRRLVETIKKSGQRAAEIVQDLLTLARRGVAVKDVLNLNDLVKEYVYSPEHEKGMSFHSGINVKRNLENKLLNIKGSSIHLKKTIMNLVSNAAEAQPNGGEIIVSTENRSIDKLMKGYDNIPEGDYAVLKVEDKGHGIAKDDLDKIFEPFYTKKVMGRSGTGLGMAVVWGTVKDHKGRINIKSVKGQGTTFELYFPATREGITEEERFSLKDYMGNGQSILIVDDIEEQKNIASLMLEKLGYKPFSVSSGEEAVEYVKDNSVDLLLLDMIMEPGIDGLETYKRILELHPNQKAIIASGFSETNRVKEAQKIGAGKYIKKPYLLEKFGLVIKAELNE